MTLVEAIGVRNRPFTSRRFTAGLPADGFPEEAMFKLTLIALSLSALLFGTLEAESTDLIGRSAPAGSLGLLQSI
ncbi:hypothetical protein [Chthonobacter albigriseus]|uniref:hypothetical protein n=1 Tax=Chthonobacter albigriseus TaxID=1683161 RepID=UPI0015EFB57F|nr:hypothetical protein [Chthonobacter albigriseus]